MAAERGSEDNDGRDDRSPRKPCRAPLAGTVIVAPRLDAEDDAERFVEKSAAPRGDGKVCEPQKFLAPVRIVSKDSRAQLDQQKLCSSDCTLTANPARPLDQPAARAVASFPANP